jgi:hypothetical protein
MQKGFLNLKPLEFELSGEVIHVAQQVRLTLEIGIAPLSFNLGLKLCGKTSELHVDVFILLGLTHDLGQFLHSHT